MPAILPLKGHDPASYGRMALMPLAKAAIDTAFQPIVETVSGKIHGYESLMRGHDRLGFDTPLTLLDAFAISGELMDLELFTTSRSFAKFTSLADFDKRTLFLNLDHRMLQAGQRLLPLLLAYLQKNAIAPSSVCIELSERSDNASAPDFADLMAQMRRMGFKLAIDDFGTGHTSIVSLLKLEPKRLKIDRQLVQPMLTASREFSLVRSIIDIGSSLDIETVAEGVETMTHAARLRELGCSALQGYAFARPMRGSELVDFVAASPWRDQPRLPYLASAI